MTDRRVRMPWLGVLLLLLQVSVRVCKPVLFNYETDQGMEVDRAPSSLELPLEVQHALCSVSTEQIRATANATITRQLRGVCHAKEVREQLQRMEFVLTREIQRVSREVRLLQRSQTSHSRPSPVIYKYIK